MKKKAALLFALLCICIIFAFIENTKKQPSVFSEENTNENTAADLTDTVNSDDSTNEMNDNTIDLSQNNNDLNQNTFDLNENTFDLSQNTFDLSQNTSDKTAVNSLSLSKEELRSLSAGTILYGKAKDLLKENCFYQEVINDDIKTRIYGKSYKKDCTVPYENLRYVRILYYGFDEETHIGELIVNTAIASDIVSIFSELYEHKYPIESVVLVDNYEADDNASMAANNTSSFNYRTVPGSSHLSSHALGLAIDINPLYNPYIKADNKGTTVLPEEGSLYADRTLDCPYYINKDDLCYQIFTRYGFTWGGSWNSVKDYQHFEKDIE